MDSGRDAFDLHASHTAGCGDQCLPDVAPDGRRVIYRSPGGLRIQDADGSSDGQTVTGTSDYDYPDELAARLATAIVFMRRPKKLRSTS